MCQSVESEMGPVRGAAPMTRNFKYSPGLSVQISPVFRGNSAVLLTNGGFLALVVQK